MSYNLHNDEVFECYQVVQTDGFMNITMAEVTFTDALGNKSKFDSFFVQSRLIRWLIIRKHFLKDNVFL